MSKDKLDYYITDNKAKIKSIIQQQIKNRSGIELLLRNTIATDEWEDTFYEQRNLLLQIDSQFDFFLDLLQYILFFTVDDIIVKKMKRNIMKQNNILHR